MIPVEALEERLAKCEVNGWLVQKIFFLRQLQHHQEIQEAWENCTLAYRSNDIIASDAWFLVCSTLVENCWQYYDVIGTQHTEKFVEMMSEPVQFNFDI